MKKRFCALLLVLCLALGLLPAAAQAAGDGSGTFDTVRWTLDADGGLTVSGTGDLPDSAFAGRTDIVTVTFTGQVARIGRSAFAGCTQLRRVDGFGAVTCVMSQAFAGCTALTELAVPGTVTEIGTGAFSACTGLTAVTLAPGVRSLGAYAFAACTALRRIDLPDGMTLLGLCCAGCTPVSRTVWDRNSPNRLPNPRPSIPRPWPSIRAIRTIYLMMWWWNGCILRSRSRQPL